VSPSTPAARRVLGGLAGSLVALAAAPGLAGTAFADTTEPGAAQYGSEQSGTGQSDLTTPDDPTPAPTGAQYGAKPETVLGGVPVEGTLNSVEGATAIVPGSGPKDYA
jgi:hypothetical protein